MTAPKPAVREAVAASPLCHRGNRYFLRHDDRQVKGVWRCVNCGSVRPEIERNDAGTV